jgi:hypothetical protein
MAGEKSDTSSLPVGNLLAIVLLIAGVAVNHIPLESARPGASAVKTAARGEVQNIDARLWQDPLAVISLYREEHRAKSDASTTDGGVRQFSLEAKPGPKERREYLLNATPIAVAPRAEDRLQKLRDELAAHKKRGSDIVVLGAMMFGGPYAEDAESRRRTRYAVLAGLDASGYKPDNAEKLGYFTNEKNSSVPEVVPFELFNNISKGNSGKCKILLLWLDENAFDPSSPLAALDHLMQEVTSEKDPATAVPDCGPRVRIIGPAGSWFLENMAGEVARGISFHGSQTNAIPALFRPTAKPKYDFYSAGVTTDLGRLFFDAVIDAAPVDRRKSLQTELDQPMKQYKQYIEHKTFRTFRTINTDGEIAEALVAELGLRGVHAAKGGDHILLVSEWDTVYGQRLPEEFISAAAHGSGLPDTQNGSPKCATLTWVTCISYLRGLDGDIPPSSASGQAAAKNDKSKDDKDKAKEAANRERAEGTSQFDYLRALATRVEERVRELHDKDAGEIKAIGVLGSDLYDKLIVLQALRPQFPKAIFFTVDLDRRLVQPSNYQWTRNLLVGSGYGFELNAGLQKSIPPFRDVYQTSTFLATQLALSQMPVARKRDALKCWLRPPRVYEIGRTQAFALQPQSEGSVAPPSGCDSFVSKPLAESAPASAPDSAAAEPRDALAGLKDVRPPLPRMFPRYSLQVWFSVFVAFGLLMLLLYRYNWGIRRTVAKLQESKKMSSVIAIGIVLVAAPAAALIVIADAGQGEPFAWAEGISLWPTQLIRYFAFFLCAFFIYRVLWPSEKEQNEMPGKFIPALLDDATKAAIDKDRRTLFRWFEKYERSSLSINVATLWAEYRALGTWRERMRRLWIPVMCYVGVCAGLIYAFGGAPNTPYRGAFSYWVNIVLVVTLVIAFVVLLFSVVDSIRLCSTFIRNLTWCRSDYPLVVRKNVRDSLYFDSLQPGCSLCDWIDMCLIAQLTERVGRQVYYPFIVLALMLVARSPLFDYWHTPVGLMLIFVLGFALAITCAIVLQRTAERARGVAIERMTRYLTHAKTKKGPSNARITQIEMLLDDVRNLRRGAFVPFMQQPLMRAVMVPVGSFGGLQLVEYFVLAWYL